MLVTCFAITAVARTLSSLSQVTIVKVRLARTILSYISLTGCAVLAGEMLAGFSILLSPDCGSVILLCAESWYLTVSLIPFPRDLARMPLTKGDLPPLPVLQHSFCGSAYSLAVSVNSGPISAGLQTDYCHCFPRVSVVPIINGFLLGHS